MKAKQFLLTFWLMLFTAAALAQDEAADAAKGSKSVYVEMQPAFIVSFGGPGPLKYLKTEVTLIVPDGTAETNVKLHMPAIRHTLVMLLSRQESETVGTAQAREHVRQQALEELRNVMVEEYDSEGYDMIKNLLFTSFVVQH